MAAGAAGMDFGLGLLQAAGLPAIELGGSTGILFAAGVCVLRADGP